MARMKFGMLNNGRCLGGPKIQVAASAIAVAVVLLPTAAWLVADGGPPWLWLAVAAAPLLGFYGIWESKRLSPRPDERTKYQPERVPDVEPPHSSDGDA